MVKFSFKKEKSSLLGNIYRPIAMIVDTGADYTLLPKFLSVSLGINLNNDYRKLETTGVGGNQKVYFSIHKVVVRVGDWQRKIPVGFLDCDFIPPLMGRHQFLETFKVIFNKRQLFFDRP